jgi:acetyl esterase
VPVDPLLQPVLDAMNAQPTASGGSAAEFEAGTQVALTTGAHILAEAAPEVAGIADHAVAMPDGEISVRIYTPFGSGPFPAHLFLHGGGFWLGMLDESDAKCRETAQRAGCVVAAVGYRLAPRYKFPTAPEDCYRALEWLFGNAAALGVDRRRVSVGGVSAGGNLAAVVALMARDREGPPLVFQLLEVPITDLTLSFPSITENGDGYVLTKESCARYVRLYLADPTQATNPYARRLESAGVAVTLVRLQGHIHGSMAFTKLMPSARDHRELVHASLRDAYRRSGPGRSYDANS